MASKVLDWRRGLWRMSDLEREATISALLGDGRRHGR
jgi:hypothetical protein